MKVSTFAAVAASLFCSSVYAGAQAPAGSVPTAPTTTTQAASATAETFTPVNTNAVNGKVVAPRASGKTYPRLEIRQLQATQPDQFSLFILAMQSWQSEAQSNPSSYFGVSSIHGVPHQNYNGVGQCSSCQNTDGYCTHNSILFPSWHRTYLAMYEQQLLARALKIAQAYTGSRQQTMLTAAARLRMPYWDWAVKPANGQPVIPALISGSTIVVNGPNGQQTISNPLYSYQYQDPSGMYYYPFSSWKNTLRYPTSNAGNAGSDSNQLTSAFNNVQRSLQDQVYQLFTSCADYGHFSNDAAASSSTQCSSSLEGIHNTVHMTSGGAGTSSTSGGHMTYLPLASFDPIFWLHHTNVDRIFAMWQTINPNAYGGSQTAPGSTWTIAAGSVSDSNSPLHPFYKDQSNFWTTNDVRDWASTFGYTYPEYANSAGDRNAIVSAVNRLYGPNAQPGAVSKRSIAAYSPAGKSAAPSAIDNAKLASNGSEYQYNANIQTPRYYLKSSFTIYIFLGAPASEDTTTWAHDANLVGPFGVMADTSSAAMTMAEIVISGSIPLTRSLQDKVASGALKSMAEADVTPYLKTNLIWKVASNNGECVDPATIPGFAVAVASTTAALPSCDSELPTYSPFNIVVDITAGLAGGLNATTKLLGDTFKGVEKVLDGVEDAVGHVGDAVEDLTGGITAGLTAGLGLNLGGKSSSGKSSIF